MNPLRSMVLVFQLPYFIMDETIEHLNQTEIKRMGMALDTCLFQRRDPIQMIL